MEQPITLSDSTIISNYFVEENSDQLSLFKGQIIYCEGNTPLGIYFLLKGKVKISKNGSDGKEQIVRIASEGELLNLADILSQTKYTTSTQVIEDSTFLFIPKKEFMNLLVQQSHLFEQILMLLSSDLKFTQQKLTDMAYKPVRGRLSQSLLYLSGKFDNNSNEYPSFHITRYDLACYVGTAKETVNRLISEFRNEGLITTHGTSINILDTAGLKRISLMYN